MEKDKETFKIYRIYSENGLLYVGKTNQPLKITLWTHFFKTPMVTGIHIDSVTKIEYALFPTAADMNLMESYYINKLKPILNQKNKAKDTLTISLPDVSFLEYRRHIIEKWRKEIRKAEAADPEKQKIKQQLEQEKRAKHHEIFHREGPSLEEKRKQWHEWLEHYYEPARNNLM